MKKYLSLLFLMSITILHAENSEFTDSLTNNAENNSLDSTQDEQVQEKQNQKTTITRKPDGGYLITVIEETKNSEPQKKITETGFDYWVPLSGVTGTLSTVASAYLTYSQANAQEDKKSPILTYGTIGMATTLLSFCAIKAAYNLTQTDNSTQKVLGTSFIPVSGGGKRIFRENSTGSHFTPISPENIDTLQSNKHTNAQEKLCDTHDLYKKIDQERKESHKKNTEEFEKKKNEFDKTVQKNEDEKNRAYQEFEKYRKQLEATTKEQDEKFQRITQDMNNAIDKATKKSEDLSNAYKNNP